MSDLKYYPVPAHPGCLRQAVVSLLLPPLDRRRRVVSRINRLRQVPQRPCRRIAVRRKLPRLDARWKLHWADRESIIVQRQLQDVPEAVLGGTSDFLREGARLNSVDVES